MMNTKSETLKNTHASGLYRMTATVSYVGELDPGKLSYKNFTGKGTLRYSYCIREPWAVYGSNQYEGDAVCNTWHSKSAGNP